MLDNCYQAPYILLISRGKKQKNAYIFGAFCLFWGKNLH